MGVLERVGLAGPVALWARTEVTGPVSRVVVARVTRDAHTHSHLRPTSALLLEAEDRATASETDSFAAVLVKADRHGETTVGESLRAYLPNELRYLEEDDVVRVDPLRNRVDVLYRRWSEHNSLLVTERCNSRCVMCSQPPVLRDDGYLVPELLQAIPLMSPETRELGFTGGEPTLLFDGLLQLIRAARDALPDTQLHILSNGRLFVYQKYANRIAAARHPGVVFGIPIYSDIPRQHDFVVQAKGAFDQTIRGLLNLARYGIRVEIRVVVHDQTYQRLPELASFIARHLGFAEHIALMGLETVGYAKTNLDAVWIDPADYQQELLMATRCLDRAGFRVSIYNHQLCLLDRELWKFAVQSISDWKNIYMPECAPCAVRSACAGFFAAGRLRYSNRIRPIIA
jgi:His-Xaa-Ser system radical SAM maturase HxsC